MNLKIYTLSRTDSHILSKLNQVFGEVFEDSSNYKDKKPRDEYLRRFLADEKNIVIVAEIDKKIVGGLVAYVFSKFEQERTEIYIYDLAIDKAKQRIGIGKQLIEKLQYEAKNIGAYVIFVQADENDEAVKFYESLQPSASTRTINFDFTV